MEAEVRRSVGGLRSKAPDHLAVLLRILPDAESLRSVICDGEPVLQGKAFVQRLGLVDQVDAKIAYLVRLGRIAGSKVSPVAQQNPVRFKNASSCILIVA